MATEREIQIAGRALFNELIGGTDESGDDICLMVGAEGYRLAKVAIEAAETVYSFVEVITEAVRDGLYEHDAETIAAYVVSNLAEAGFSIGRRIENL